jgi:hypothetical protein
MSADDRDVLLQFAGPRPGAVPLEEASVPERMENCRGAQSS